MEENHLASFEVSGFKKFNKLEVENIGQFNLIVGDNNVGKTTFLEALLIDLDSERFLESLSNIMFKVKKFTRLNNHFLTYFFSNNFQVDNVVMRFKTVKKNGEFDLVEYERRSISQIVYRYSLNSEFPNPHSGNKINMSNPSDNFEFNFEIPYIPFGSLYSHELTKQYSDYIQLFVDKKEQLIDSLTRIIPNIKNIEVNASYSNAPILLISEKNKNMLSPLATYGDGALKLFRALLSLFANSHYNRLMIDELDAGVHYSRLKEFIKSLLGVAKEQKKQIFATTHSKECIEAFIAALKEAGLEQDGRIIRLADTKHGIKAYTNIYEQFNSVIKAEGEIR